MKTLRILLVHNAYQQRGGEDSVVDAELELLRNHGHTVELFFRTNDALHEMSRVNAAVHTIWSTEVERAFETLVRSFKPDVVHAHNTFPLISPAIYWVADRMHVPVVQTLHNFRLMCPQAMFLRDGKVCEDCLGKVPWRGALRGCYRGSRLQSTVLAGMLALHRAIGTWENKVTRYIALNEFCRRKFIECGLPGERIVVKPNFVDFEVPSDVARSGFLFVGRLSAEKGVGVLVGTAALMRDAQLRIAGEGPNTALVDGVKGIKLLGKLSKDVVRHEMNMAVAVVVPSICYETFGVVVVEAFASSTPVIASRIESLPNLVIDRVTGLLFEPGNSKDLADQMLWAREHPEQMAEMGRNARALYEAEFSAERNYQQLMAIYQEAMAAVKAGQA